MNDFEYVTPTDLPGASAALGDQAAVLSGGIDLLTQLKQGIASPKRVVNLKTAQEPALRRIEAGDDLHVGGLVTLTALIGHEALGGGYAALREAAGVVGSPQIRNVGTVGGNLCQRPRCWYFRDPEVLCLKKGGDTCFAVDGRNAYHAVLQGGPCWIVHPSDLAPALIALDGVVLVHDGQAERTVSAAGFFVHPETDVSRETILKPNEIVTGVRVPGAMTGWRSAYYKMRERESFDWALASAAVALKLDGDRVADARVVLGGVAPVPLRSVPAEEALKGAPVTSERALAAGRAAFEGAQPLKENRYKVKLGPNVVRIAALRAAGREAR